MTGYRVRYITNAALVSDLNGSPADDTLTQRLGYYAHFDLLIIDEFGFENPERTGREHGLAVRRRPVARGVVC